jgi:glycosyltransferase involved in cell wall biosynthesis
MRILWSSNSPAIASGYGQTTARFLPRIRALGHEVAVYANYGQQGGPGLWNDIFIYPQGVGDPWGSSVLTAYLLHWLEGDRNAGWLIMLQDVWVMKDVEKLKEYHVAAWAPVDHTPCPPKVAQFFENTGAVPLSMSKHGHRMFEEAGLNPIYVPHGIDTTLFAPRDTRTDMRDALGIPAGAFVYGMVAANIGVPIRKGFPEAFAAFAKVQRKHSDAFLYLHTVARNTQTGAKLYRLLEELDIPETAYAFVDQIGYEMGLITTELMPPVYSALDVLVNPAYGEGFGMPIIEAQACGVPVILADNTAQRELCGGGWLVPTEPLWDEAQASWWGRVHVSDLASTMERAYKASLPGIGKKAREFVVANYDADDITERYWKPALDELASMLKPPEAEPVDPTAITLA